MCIYSYYTPIRCCYWFLSLFRIWLYILIPFLSIISPFISIFFRLYQGIWSSSNTKQILNNNFLSSFIFFRTRYHWERMSLSGLKINYLTILRQKSIMPCLFSSGHSNMEHATSITLYSFYQRINTPKIYPLKISRFPHLPLKNISLVGGKKRIYFFSPPKRKEKQWNKKEKNRHTKLIIISK